MRFAREHIERQLAYRDDDASRAAAFVAIRLDYIIDPKPVYDQGRPRWGIIAATDAFFDETRVQSVARATITLSVSSIKEALAARRTALERRLFGFAIRPSVPARACPLPHRAR